MSKTGALHALVFAALLSGCQHHAPVGYAELAFDGVVRQSMEISCGAAALATYFTHVLDHPLSERELLEATLQNASAAKKARIDEFGLSLADLYRQGQARGYVVTAAKIPLHSLRNLAHPAIVHLTLFGYEHFALVRAFRGGHVYVADSVFGHLVVPEHQFAAMWTDGVVMLLEPPDFVWPRNALALQPNEDFGATLRRIRRQRSEDLGVVPDVAVMGNRIF